MSDGPVQPAAVARPTMHDVAALAGVSLKTVSRVVNGVSTVDPTMAAKVRSAAAKLGYRPNLTASNLRRRDRRTLTIGMLVDDAANPFSAALMRAVENVAHAHGVLVLFGSVDEDPAREHELAGALIDRRVDGLVIVPSSRDHSYLLRERDAGMCMVFLDRPPSLLDADAVLSDNRVGAETAVAHLIAAGHPRIAYMGDRAALFTAAERFAGYRTALERSGHTVDPRHVHHDVTTEERAVELATELFDGPDAPTAIFASRNVVSIGVSRALRALGRHHDVAVVGFDDFPLADLLTPGITVVAQDNEQLGRRAADLLFRRIAGDVSPTDTHVVPTRLIPRGSGEIPAPARFAAPSRRRRRVVPSAP